MCLYKSALHRSTQSTESCLASKLNRKPPFVQMSLIRLVFLEGYGRRIFSIWRRDSLEFPLTVGRDFSGIVVDKGHQVGSEFNIGDRVYGFVPLHRQGCHSEAVLVHKGHVRHQPTHLTPIQAASLPYVSMTAWSALFVTGELIFREKRNCRVLVLGASGGVGTLAVQLLKSQGCDVN